MSRRLGKIIIFSSKRDLSIFFLKDIKKQHDRGSLWIYRNLDHTRNYETIVGSFGLNLPYAYLVADVNGAIS